MNLLYAAILTFKLLIQDPTTNEPLTGVKVITQYHTYYTNLQGEVEIPVTDTVTVISYVSYQQQFVNIAKDSIINLQSIELQTME